MKCNVCGSEQIDKLGPIKDRDIEAMYCAQCDTVFPFRYPTSAELNEYYSGFTAAHQHGSKLRENVATYYSKRKCRAILRQVRKYGPVNQVLDFGGGSGYFARGFKLNGVEVELYDIDKESMNVAEQRGIETISNVDFEKQYDLVFSSHVIEHYPDLHQFMEQTVKAVKPRGILAFCCPNKNANEFYRPSHVRNYRNRIESKPGELLATSRWFCFDPPRHLHAISEKTFSTLGKVHGLELLASFTEYSRCANFHSGDLPFPFLIKPLLKNKRALMELLVNVVFSRLIKIMGGKHGDSVVALFRKP